MPLSLQFLSPHQWLNLALLLSNVLLVFFSLKNPHLATLFLFVSMQCLDIKCAVHMNYKSATLNFTDTHSDWSPTLEKQNLAIQEDIDSCVIAFKQLQVRCIFHVYMENTYMENTTHMFPCALYFCICGCRLQSKTPGLSFIVHQKNRKIISQASLDQGKKVSFPVFY